MTKLQKKRKLRVKLQNNQQKVKARKKQKKTLKSQKNKNKKIINQ